MKKLFGKLGAGKLKEGLARTRQKFTENVHRVLAGKTRIDEDALEELEEALIGSDAGVATAERLVARLRERVREEGIEDGETLETALAEEIAGILKGAEASPTADEVELPRVILLVGVNGTGKTTTLGKLARIHREAGETVLLAAADTFRAAAVDQLRIWGDRVGVEVVANDSGADPAAVAFDAVSRARARKVDTVFIDTAGRLQNQVNLMEELRKISRVVGKQHPGAPHEVFLVLDATTGQNAVQQARQFGEVVDVTGIVLTKVDGTAKGGIVVAIAAELGVPVRYLGVGEGVEDLEPFHAERFAAALFETA